MHDAEGGFLADARHAEGISRQKLRRLEWADLQVRDIDALHDCLPYTGNAVSWIVGREIVVWDAVTVGDLALRTLTAGSYSERDSSWAARNTAQLETRLAFFLLYAWSLHLDGLP